MDISAELKKIVASNEELNREQFRDLYPYIITQKELSKEDKFHQVASDLPIIKKLSNSLEPIAILNSSLYLFFLPKAVFQL